MSMLSESQYPKVSFIMPTLNAAALVENCLASIARQTYPRDRYEIVLADAGSTDGTREIAGKYGALILDDHGRNMEEGKRLALAHATGEYIVFVDADNELTHPDYVALAVQALAAHPQALGVESYYLPSAKMSSFCAYVTHLLHISDPVCWLMSTSPELVATEGEVERWTLPKGSLAYPLGANGFVFRKADLDAVKAQQHFQDTHIALYLMQSGRREWLRIRGRGVHHYYVQTLWGFLQKRRRAMVHFMNVRREVLRFLDGPKTAGARLAGLFVWGHFRRPYLPHPAGFDPGSGCALALPRARQLFFRGRHSLGLDHPPAARQRPAADRGFEAEAGTKTEKIATAFFQ